MEVVVGRLEANPKIKSIFSPFTEISLEVVFYGVNNTQKCVVKGQLLVISSGNLSILSPEVISFFFFFILAVRVFHDSDLK